MESLLAFLPLAGCAAMMFVCARMMTGGRKHDSPSVAQDEIAQLRDEVARLRAERADDTAHGQSTT